MKRWQKKEVRDAKSFSGRRQARSGGLWNQKGDVRSAEWLIECKSTEQKGYRLTPELWKKIRSEAIKSGRKPLLSIELNDGTELCVLGKDDLVELLKSP